MPSNPSGTFSRTVTAWSFPTGAEIGGRSSLNLTPSGIDAGTLFGVTAGVFGAGDFARISSPTFLGLSDLSIEFTIRFTGMTATGYIIKVGSPTTTANRALTVRLALVSGNLVWRLERLGAGGTVQVSTSAAAVAQDTDYHVIIILQSGQSNRLIVNGLAVALTHVPTTPVTGVIPILTTDELAIGDPTPTNENSFLGTLGRLVVYPYVMTDTQIATASIAALDQRQLISIGAATAIGAANHGPVAVPFYSASIEANGTNSIDLNTPGRGFDADGNALTAIDAGGSGGQGTVTITATNMLRYTPTGGTGGILPHTVPQRIRDPGNLVGNSIVNVPVTNPSGGDFFDLVGEPWIPNDNRNITTALGNLTALADGRTYRLPAGTFNVVLATGSGGTGASTLQANVRLAGRGMGLDPLVDTILRIPNDTYSATGTLGNTESDQTFRMLFNFQGRAGIRLQDMTIDGNYQQQTILNNAGGTSGQPNFRDEFYRPNSGGENGGWHCVRFGPGSNNCSMTRVRCRRAGTDGVKIDGANNLTFTDCIFELNRRMGCCPSNGNTADFLRCFFDRNGSLARTGVTAGGRSINKYCRPASGFDIEPNSGSENVDNYTLRECHFDGNGFAGFFTHTGDSASGSHTDNLELYDCQSLGNNVQTGGSGNESYQFKMGPGARISAGRLIRCIADDPVAFGSTSDTVTVLIDDFIMDGCTLRNGTDVQITRCNGSSRITIRNCINVVGHIDPEGNSPDFELVTNNNT